jgi:hypothetical protein
MTDEKITVKPIVITNSQTKEQYTLEFSRDTVRFAEVHGFEWDDVGKYPMTKIPEIFYYSFRMHHPNIARANTDKLLELMGGMSAKFLARLRELYDAPFLTLINTGDETNSKNGILTVDLD